MNDLTLPLFRFGLLALMWIFIFIVILALWRDIGGGKKPKKNKKEEVPAYSSETEQSPKQLAKNLVVVDGPQRGTTLPLSNSPVTLGRAQDSTFVLTDDYSSGRHARLFPQGSRWFIEDLGSTNGVTINGEPLARTTSVELNTPIQIGKTVMELRP